MLNIVCSSPVWLQNKSQTKTGTCRWQQPGSLPPSKAPLRDPTQSPERLRSPEPPSDFPFQVCNLVEISWLEIHLRRGHYWLRGHRSFTSNSGIIQAGKSFWVQSTDSLVIAQSTRIVQAFLAERTFVLEKTLV